MPRLFVIFLMVKIILVPISNCHFLHSLELPSKLYCNLFQDYFFVYYCRNDLLARPFVFSSSKKLWTTLLKTWIWYIFFCNSYGYYFCRVESSWAISLLRRSNVSELFTKDLNSQRWLWIRYKMFILPGQTVSTLMSTLKTWTSVQELHHTNPILVCLLTLGDKPTILLLLC